MSNQVPAHHTREQAKRAVVSTDDNDKELNEAFSSAHEMQLHLQRENNRHTEVMHDREKGMIGRFFGNQSNAGSLAAMIALIVGLLGAGVSLMYANEAADNISYWDKVFERCLAFASTALAFIFGKSASK